METLVFGFALLAALLFALSELFKIRGWIAAGIVTLLALLYPTHTIIDGFYPDVSPAASTLFTIMIYAIPSFALIVSAALLHFGLSSLAGKGQVGQVEENPASHFLNGRGYVVALVLSALLIAKTLHNMYWLLVWDGTTDGLEALWLGFPVLISFTAGFLAAAALPPRFRWAGLSALAVPALLIATGILAFKVDHYQLTTWRAERVVQAIEAYHIRTGRYPADLRELTPYYLLTVPGPVVIYGQNWCYQAGDDYFRLGYVDREHWSSPELLNHEAASRGDPPDIPVCDQAIRALEARYPDFYGLGKQ